MDRTEKLRNGSIPKLLFSLAIPSIIAQLVNILYNMVDRIFVGRTPEGNLAMSALSVALPIITFINAVTHLVGLGDAPLAAIKLGANDKNSAEKNNDHLICFPYFYGNYNDCRY